MNTSSDKDGERDSISACKEVSSSSSDGGGGGCFIATAAYGSLFEGHVEILRQFRDVYLLPTRAGQAFVNAYYRYSPPVAKFIADHNSLRVMVRWSLAPVVGMSWLAFQIGIIPLLFFIFFVIMGIGAVFFYIKGDHDLTGRKRPSCLKQATKKGGEEYYFIPFLLF